MQQSYSTKSTRRSTINWVMTPGAMPMTRPTSSCRCLRKRIRSPTSALRLPKRCSRPPISLSSWCVCFCVSLSLCLCQCLCLCLYLCLCLCLDLCQGGFRVGGGVGRVQESHQISCKYFLYVFYYFLCVLVLPICVLVLPMCVLLLPIFVLVLPIYVF